MKTSDELTAMFRARGLRVPGRYRRDFTVDTVEVIFRGRCDDCSQEE